MTFRGLIIKFVCILLLCLIINKDSYAGENIYKKSTTLMDTLVSITVVSEKPGNAEKAIDFAFSEIKRLERLISFWDERSEISAINRNAGITAVRVSPDTLDIIEKALFVSSITGGAFDATVGPVIRLWDFNNRKKPDEKSIREKLGLVNYRQISLDRKNSTVFLRKRNMSFDTGGIAKGYAADRAVEVLRKNGIKAGLVAVAGDIKAFGLKPDKKPWRIGIKNPRQKGKNDEIMAEVELLDEAISTSGDYERFFIMDNRRYHHIIDPRTGRPASAAQSVSVIAKEGVFTDGLSTGIFVLGPEKGMKVLKKMGFEGIIVDSADNVHVTEGIKDRIYLRKEP